VAAHHEVQGLLMKALGVPETAPFTIRGWIENSFTGNANGRGSGTNFGVYPNYKADQWMGNQYYLIVQKPLRQDDTINVGFRMDNLFGNDWQYTYMQGLFNRAFPNGWFPGYDLPQLYGEVHLPILTTPGPRRQGRPLVHHNRLRSHTGAGSYAPLPPLRIHL